MMSGYNTSNLYFIGWRLGCNNLRNQGLACPNLRAYVHRSDGSNPFWQQLFVRVQV